MARNQQHNERMRDERKARIRQEALCQFASKGLSATKIKDIADAVGMAQGLIYHYYRSKEEIYLELILEALNKLNAAALQLNAAPEPPHQKIRTAIVQMYRTIETSEDFIQTCRLIAQATHSSELPEDARKQIDSVRNVPYEAVASIIASGQAEGTVVPGDPTQLAVLFWTSINGLAIYRATRPQDAVMPAPRFLIGLFLTQPDG